MEDERSIWAKMLNADFVRYENCISKRRLSIATTNEIII